MGVARGDDAALCRGGDGRVPDPNIKASLESDSTAWLRWGGPMTCNIWLETETGVSP